MRERAERAEKQVDDLLEILGSERSIVSTLRPIEVVRPEPATAPSPPQEVEDMYPLPPLVEEAIRRRAPIGSPLHAKLIDEARNAVETLGPDFDEEAYAERVVTGTRIHEWPL